jgi:hypothetical protein
MELRLRLVKHLRHTAELKECPVVANRPEVASRPERREWFIADPLGGTSLYGGRT